MQKKSIIKLVIVAIILVTAVTYFAVTKALKKNKKAEKEVYIPNKANAPRITVLTFEEDESVEFDPRTIKNRPRIFLVDEEEEYEEDLKELETANNLGPKSSEEDADVAVDGDAEMTTTTLNPQIL